MIKLCQRDPIWSDQTIGTTMMTVARWGCLITSMSMLTDYFGNYRDPATLAKAGSIIKYNSSGQVIWDTVKLSCMKFERRIKYREDVEILRSLKDPDKAVCLEVDGSHWVVATGKNLLFDGYKIVDPWTGRSSTTGAYKNITGSAHFVRNS